MQSSSKPYKIFGHGRGIDISQQQSVSSQSISSQQIITGRNVQPFSSSSTSQTSTKKLEHQLSQKNIIIHSPFEGYSSNLTTVIDNMNSMSNGIVNNNLAYSQVSDLNLELTRRLIKEEMSKIGLYDQNKMRNDIQVIKTELRSVKEYINGSGNLGRSQENDEKFRKQMLDDFNKLLAQYHDQTAKNLRQVIKKFDENIKKDCHSKFLPLQFLNDVQKQFFELQDKLDLALSKVDGKQKPNQNPLLVAQAFQLRLKKNQRQSESLKKLILDITSQIKQNIENVKNKLAEDEQRTISKLQEFKRHVNQSQKQFKSLNGSLDQVKKQQSENSRKLVTLHQQLTNIQQDVANINTNANSSPQRWIKQTSNQSSQVKQFLNSSKGLVTSSVFQNSTKQPLNNNSNSANRQLFKSPIKQNNLFHKQSTKSIDGPQEPGHPPPSSSNSNSNTNTNSNATPYSNNNTNATKKQQKQQQQQSGISYRLDKDNYLLDEDGNYILNDNGKMIQLTQQQIVILRQSTLVKLKQ